jgi:hypothetical protein
VQFAEREFEEPVEERVHRLGPDPLRQGRRVGDVAKKDGCLLPLAFERAPGNRDLLRQVGLCVALGWREGSGRYIPSGWTGGRRRRF